MDFDHLIDGSMCLVCNHSLVPRMVTRSHDIAHIQGILNDNFNSLPSHSRCPFKGTIGITHNYLNLSQTIDKKVTIYTFNSGCKYI
jgi:hypothetical protein